LYETSVQHFLTNLRKLELHLSGSWLSRLAWPFG